MTWENNVNLAQTEVRADGGLANALRRLGHLDENIVERCDFAMSRCQSNDRWNTLQTSLPVVQRSVGKHPHAAAAVRVGRLHLRVRAERAVFSCVSFLSLACPLSLCAYMNAHTHSLSLSLSHSLSLSLTLARSLSLPLSLSLSHTQTHTHTQTQTHTIHTHIQLSSLRCQYRDCKASCSKTTRYVRAHTYTHTYAHTYTHTHIHTHTYARTHSHIQTHTSTHAHTQVVTVRHIAQERHGIACECVWTCQAHARKRAHPQMYLHAHTMYI